MARLLILVVLLATLGACGTDPLRGLRDFFQPYKGQAALAAGLKQYEDGRYADSIKSLRSAIDQGLADADKVNAHKHLAFIHCAAQRERLCREEFRNALAVDPEMDLAPAEAGHPLWGPVFRSVKAGR